MRKNVFSNAEYLHYTERVPSFQRVLQISYVESYLMIDRLSIFERFKQFKYQFQ